MPDAESSRLSAEALRHATDLQRAGRHAEALKRLERAGESADAFAARGRSLAALRQGEDALAAYDAAFAINPDLPYLAGARWRQAAEICAWDGFAARRQDMIDAMERGVAAAAPFIALSADRPDLARRAAAEWLSAYPQGRAHPPTDRRDGRVRVAWLSGDFRRHAMAYLLTGVLEQMDRGRFHNIGLSVGPDDRSDERRRIAAAFEHFIDIRARPDDEAVALARSLECDIAIDLTGFTQHGRFGLFTQRMAPIQLGWLGYPGGMGSPAWDYIIADHVVIPEGAKGDYAECVARLPHAYQPTDNSRVVGRPPGRRAAGLSENGFVFCCFNAASKLSPDMFDVWMRILSNTPGSVLWLMTSREPVPATLRREAEKRGVDPARLVFAPALAHLDHLARIAEADLILDTLPYNAHTTASDALWAGVPVLTTPGAHFAGRVAASLLHAVGLPELIAPDMTAYERMAIRLAANAGELAALRRRLAANRQTAPLFDTGRFARDLERLLAAIHARSAAGLAPAPLSVRA